MARPVTVRSAGVAPSTIRRNDAGRQEGKGCQQADVRSPWASRAAISAKEAIRPSRVFRSTSAPPKAVRAAAARASKPTPGSSSTAKFHAAWRGPHEFRSGLSGVRQAIGAPAKPAGAQQVGSFYLLFAPASSEQAFCSLGCDFSQVVIDCVPSALVRWLIGLRYRCGVLVAWRAERATPDRLAGLWLTEDAQPADER